MLLSKNKHLLLQIHNIDRLWPKERRETELKV